MAARYFARHSWRYALVTEISVFTVSRLLDRNASHARRCGPTYGPRGPPLVPAVQSVSNHPSGWALHLLALAWAFQLFFLVLILAKIILIIVSTAILLLLRFLMVILIINLLSINSIIRRSIYDLLIKKRSNSSYLIIIIVIALLNFLISTTVIILSYFYYPFILFIFFNCSTLGFFKFINIIIKKIYLKLLRIITLNIINYFF